MKIFDSHLHLFSKLIIENVAAKKEMCTQLHLQTTGAEKRRDVEGLEKSMKAAGVTAGLALPTASAATVARVNSQFIEKAAERDFLYTAGTLHPDYADNQGELRRLKSNGVRAIKLCSFSQGFALDGPSALNMFEQIQAFNRTDDYQFFVILDTLHSAPGYFGADPAHITTPEKLVMLAKKFPDIPFVGAHMGSLDAPAEDIESHLMPRGNLYLDTSNAAYTLTKAQFITLLKRFGPERILFGTDWPWFLHSDEVPLIDYLADRAGFGKEDKAALFHDNAAELLNLSEIRVTAEPGLQRFLSRQGGAPRFFRNPHTQPSAPPFPPGQAGRILQ